MAAPLKQVVMERGPSLTIKDAHAFAQSIPKAERHAGGCHKVVCPVGCCVGCSLHVSCGECLWAPTFCIFNPLIHLTPCMCFLTTDNAGPVAEKGTHAMYEVDRETHTKAFYWRGCAAMRSSYVSEEPEATPCFYCVPLG